MSMNIANEHTHIREQQKYYKNLNAASVNKK